ncbi:nuclease-related domain-containing protein [Paraburkholderia sp. A3BS-1L]|uniref:nuclease-related domain-containing protein n=1 Tax=Paraburkholderia sp. A3BS-1L TaxID=3028375 RepID=UPI003DA84F9F
MSGFFAYLAIGYLGWRLIGRACHNRPVRGTRGFARPSDHVEQTPTTRAHACGEASEVAVRAELRRVLTGLCGDDFYLHDGAVLLHHAPGTALPTAEIDHLAVTPFGLFVIETKNWGRFHRSRCESQRTGARQQQRLARDTSLAPRTKPHEGCVSDREAAACVDHRGTGCVCRARLHSPPPSAARAHQYQRTGSLPASA